MHLSTVLAVSASLFAVGYAADPSLAFTSWPKDIQAGKPVTLTWAGADPNEPVTLGLRKGDSDDLSDVETITDEARDGTFTWTPGDNVKDGNYAFQVMQKDQSNYSGLMKAGPAPDKSQSASDSTATATATATTASNTETATSSKPLISSASSATPSSSSASASHSSSSVAGPFMTSTAVINGKEASSTGSSDSGAASLSRSSTELMMGAVAAFFYLAY